MVRRATSVSEVELDASGICIAATVSIYESVVVGSRADISVVWYCKGPTQRGGVGATVHVKSDSLRVRVISISSSYSVDNSVTIGWLWPLHAFCLLGAATGTIQHIDTSTCRNNLSKDVFVQALVFEWTYYTGNIHGDAVHSAVP